ncbi:MAG: FAD-dependent oxidoreductase [Halobacteria archaeon]|nr:FAD-dependent oxidoreductase [Halobacteria archaeon]
MEDTEPFVVIGGDAAGMSAASKSKREEPEREVIVFEKGDWVSYAACGMPYYIKGEVESLDDLVSITPEEFREERDIDLRMRHEVVEIRPDESEVVVDDRDTGETFEQGYGDLLIATGATAVEPPIDGVELDGVFTLHSMDDADEIDDYVSREDVESFGIVGGGYVGMEMSEALRSRGVDVHVFEALPHVLQPFGEDAAEVVEDHVREKGVDLHLETSVEGITGDDGVRGIETGEETYDLDGVIVGVGVAPNVGIADEAGIEIGETGAIATDDYGRSNYEDIYAAGDCAEATNSVTREPDHVPLALTANRHGRAVGQTVSGSPTEVGEIVGTAVVKVFDLEVARTGIVDHKVAEEAGFDPVSRTITAESRAGYYPGAKPIQVRLTADSETERLLGATMVSEDTAAKRIDTVATALHAGMTVDDLENLDLSYAPPFSPVWDATLTAAKVLRSTL